MKHELKTWPEPYGQIVTGAKRYEVRAQDRDFKVGDWLRLREWDPHTAEYSGREAECQILYMTEGGDWGLPSDICVMSLGNGIIKVGE